MKKATKVILITSISAVCVAGIIGGTFGIINGVHDSYYEEALSYDHQLKVASRFKPENFDISGAYFAIMFSVSRIESSRLFFSNIGKEVFTETGIGEQEPKRERYLYEEDKNYISTSSGEHLPLNADNAFSKYDFLKLPNVKDYNAQLTRCSLKSDKTFNRKENYISAEWSFPDDSKCQVSSSLLGIDLTVSSLGLYYDLYYDDYGDKGYEYIRNAFYEGTGVNEDGHTYRVRIYVDHYWNNEVNYEPLGSHYLYFMSYRYNWTYNEYYLPEFKE